MTELWITDEIEAEALERLTARNELFRCRRTDSPASDPSDPRSVIGLLVRTATRVDQKLIEKFPALQVVARAGSGLDNLDLKALREHSIEVLHSPGCNAVSAAEHSLGLLLSAARMSFAAHLDMKTGNWNRVAGIELQDKVLGILGFGNVGQALARRAAGLGLKVIACDPYKEALEAKRLGVELLSLSDLLKASDFLSLHLPLTGETERILSDEEFEQMKPGSILVNTSRGACVDDKALLESLDNGRLYAAALDVFAEEPLKAKHLFTKHPKILLTPHIAGQTKEALLRTHLDIAGKLIEFFEKNEEKDRNEDLDRESK